MLNNLLLNDIFQFLHGILFHKPVRRQLLQRRHSVSCLVLLRQRLHQFVRRQDMSEYEQIFLDKCSYHSATMLCARVLHVGLGNFNAQPDLLINC